jgi:hypothetical protein
VTQSPVLQPGRSATQRTPRPKILIGAGLAFIACTTLGGVVPAFGSSSTTQKPTIDSAAASPAISAPAVVATPRQAFVADRWYEDTVASTTGTRVLSEPPVRDAWERDQSTGVTALPPARSSSTPRVADRWYEDTPNANDAQSTPGAPAISGAVAFDNSTSVNAPRLSQQARDTWYLDSASDGH